MTEHEQMIEDCESREGRLSDSDRVYVDSFAKQLRDGRSLSKRQVDVLDDIWEKATSNG